MNELTVHPNVYATGASGGLLSLLERVWIREHSMGDGTLYIVSGFANYNGGIRFFPFFRNHAERGGRIVAIFGGNSQQRLTSKQVVREMLECGAEVHVVNRKRLMHVKSYGSKSSGGETVVVTSGNFTGPGMSQNVEMSLLLDRPATREIGFSWDDFVSSMLSQRWQIHQPKLADADDALNPAWRLLYDEQLSTVPLEDEDEVTMILRLGHADTVRINAEPGSRASRGTQYFWLSKDCYDFFPALTVTNRRGYKRTYSRRIRMRYVDIGEDAEVTVAFEAENNLDFRLGTGRLRGTRLARRDDIAAISRVGDSDYQLRLYRQDSEIWRALDSYAIHFIGNRGKRYGFISNQEFETVAGVERGELTPGR